MFLALHHSAHAAICVFVARAMFLEAAVLLEISSSIQGKTSLVHCHCSCILLNKMKIFDGGNTSVLCSGISVGWMFASVFNCCEARNHAV